MNARSIMRPVVWLLSLAAIVWLVGLVAVGLINRFNERMDWDLTLVFVGVGVLGFLIANTVAWVISALSGIPGTSGLILPFRTRQIAHDNQASVGPSGVGGWLGFSIFGLMVALPLSGLTNTAKDLRAAESTYPDLLLVAAWGNYKIAMWCIAVTGSAMALVAGFRLFKVLKRESVQFAVLTFWVVGPVIAILHTLTASIFLDLDFWPLLSERENMVALTHSTLMATIWTLYYRRSRRVRNTYYGALYSDSQTSYAAPDKREPTL